MLCSVARSPAGDCGPDGNLFVDREASWSSSAIETKQATIRQETDRPWEKDGKKDYSPE